MSTYIIRVYKLGSLINKETITAIDSLSAINYHIAAGEYPTFEMRGPDGKVHNYVEAQYSFEARQLTMEMS